MTPRPAASPIRLRVRAIAEAKPGPVLGAVLNAYWPAYRRWIARADPLTAGACRDQIARHMPELAPVLERIAALGPEKDRDKLVRFLSLYRPPRVVRGCSQAILRTDDGPVLVRNYDHAPHLCDGIVLASSWLGTRVVAVTDCLWGALDGINEHGLAVALAFGGRPDTGDGFGAQLVVRYLLETCRTTAQARAALDRLPVSMPYTFVTLDRAGDFTTAFCGPGRPARFEHDNASTNHQGAVEWPAYAAHCQTVERLDRIRDLLTSQDPRDAEDAFLRPPLYRTDYARASGTLYTSVYRPAAGTLTLRWPGQEAAFGIDHFEPSDRTVTIGTPQPAGT